MNERKREMKFKVGDKVIGNSKANVYGITKQGWLGTVTSTRASAFDTKEYWALDYDRFDLAPTNKILITSDGSTTLARLYDSGKVIRRAEAKCSPSDTYEFELGACIAVGRLYDREVSIDGVSVTTSKPEPPKHEYKVGQKVKVIANTCFHNSRVGEIITLERKRDSSVASWYYKEHLGYIGESDIEPYTEPKQEPIKLYCVESDGFFQEGKVYTIESDGTLMLERGYKDSHRDFADVLRVHPQLTGKIFPLVSRPAKVGEWVYVLNNSRSTYESNKIYKVHANSDNDIWFADDGKGYISLDDYLVLDGYTEEEKPKEPEGWNGEVVCTAWQGDYFTVGYKYPVVNGKLKSNQGFKTCEHKTFKTFDEISQWECGKFVEYKGEA